VRPWHRGPLAKKLAGGHSLEKPWDTGAMPEKIHPWTGEDLHLYPQILERSQKIMEGFFLFVLNK